MDPFPIHAIASRIVRTPRARKTLADKFMAAGFTCAQDFEGRERDVLRLRNFGKKKYEKLRNALIRKGVCFVAIADGLGRKWDRKLVLDRMESNERAAVSHQQKAAYRKQKADYWRKIAKLRGWL